MLANAQVSLVRVMHEAVEDVRRLAHRRRDYPRVEWAVAARDVGIDHEPRVVAVFGVHRAAGAAAARRPKILAVRGGGRAVVPDRRQRMLVMRVDDRGAGRDVVGVTIRK